MDGDHRILKSWLDDCMDGIPEGMSSEGGMPWLMDQSVKKDGLPAYLRGCLNLKLSAYPSIYGMP